MTHVHTTEQNAGTWRAIRDVNGKPSHYECSYSGLVREVKGVSATGTKVTKLVYARVHMGDRTYTLDLGDGKKVYSPDELVRDAFSKTNPDLKTPTESEREAQAVHLREAQARINSKRELAASERAKRAASSIRNARARCHLWGRVGRYFRLAGRITEKEIKYAVSYIGCSHSDVWRIARRLHAKNIARVECDWPRDGEPRS